MVTGLGSGRPGLSVMRLANLLKHRLWLLLLVASWSAVASAERVVLQLPWYHQFQFAGYYAAKQQGYFAEAGIEVDIRAGVDRLGNTINPVEEVVFQRVDFGITRSDLLVHHARGLPVVMLATIMQRTPAAFITLEKYGIQRLEDIGSKPVSLPLEADNPGAVIDLEVIAALARAGVDKARLNNSFDSWNLAALQNGETQLLLGFANDEPYILERRGYKPVVISPRDYGIDLYGDLLFTSESTLRTEPALVEGFRKAVLRGWQYALANPDATARHILSEYPLRNSDYDLDFLLQEARKLRSYIQPDLIEIGYSNRERWQRIKQVYQQVGITDPVDLDRFLYSPEKNSRVLSWLWPVSLVVIVLLLGLIAWLAWTRLHLANKVRHGEQREIELRRQAETDPLTGLVNRRRFSLELDVGYLRARNENSPLAMLMLDVDHFKKVNDEHGHLAGDKVLCSLANICKSVTRDSDVLCRYGGEEFAFLLLDTHIDEARDVAERLMRRIHDDLVVWEDKRLRYSASIGIAVLNDDDQEGTDLLRRTDRHLYRAKAAGRDTIFAEAAGRLHLVRDV